MFLGALEVAAGVLEFEPCKEGAEDGFIGFLKSMQVVVAGDEEGLMGSLLLHEPGHLLEVVGPCCLVLWTTTGFGVMIDDQKFQTCRKLVPGR